MKMFHHFLHWLKCLPYKRIFWVCAAVLGLYLVVALLFNLGGQLYYRYRDRFSECDHPVSCWYDHKDLSPRYGFHTHENGRGFIYDRLSGKHVIKNLDWVVTPQRGDSLACACSHSLRGYINVFTGQWIVKPTYRHAWVYSCGIAAVEQDGKILFLNPDGERAFAYTADYIPKEDYVFHKGFCVIPSWQEGQLALLNQQGKLVLSSYTLINYCPDEHRWITAKGDSTWILDEQLHPVLSLKDCSIQLTEDGLEVTHPDNTMQRYDLQGQLQDAFCMTTCYPLTYEDKHDHRARLWVYEAGRGKVGLMTPDGHPVTFPKYDYIEALGPNTYACAVSDNEKVVLNFDK